ncbi:Purine permease 3 [Linum grandiflorum]
MEKMEANKIRSSEKDDETTSGMSKSMKRTLLIVNCIMLSFGSAVGPLVLRLYFIKGGTGVWTSAALETAGWPFIIFPLTASYFYRRSRNGRPGKATTTVSFITWRLALASAVFGVLTGLDDFLYASGVNYLPVSTVALIIAAQLAFTAVFAFLLVRQKFTAFSVNAIFLLCVGAGTLAVNASSDRPVGETAADYFKGFFMTVCAALLYGFVLPAVELTYKKADQTVTYTLVLEMQMVISFFATAFNVVGMIVHNEFQAMPREAAEFKMGKVGYCLVLACVALIWQCFFLGAVGVVSCGSSLLSGILIATFLPVTEILAVLIYHEKFGSQKAVALILSLWGFVSYFYGEYKLMKQDDSSPARG